MHSSYGEIARETKKSSIVHHRRMGKIDGRADRNTFWAEARRNCRADVPNLPPNHRDPRYSSLSGPWPLACHGPDYRRSPAMPSSIHDFRPATPRCLILPYRPITSTLGLYNALCPSRISTGRGKVTSAGITKQRPSIRFGVERMKNQSLLACRRQPPIHLAEGEWACRAGSALPLFRYAASKFASILFLRCR